MRVEKKIWPKYFQEIFDNRKTYEVRLNDFEIAEGDTLVLREWNPDTGTYTGREIEKKVGFVGKWKIDDLTEFWSRGDIEDKGILMISLKD